MANLDCLTTLVGLTDKDCPCFDPAPENWNTSSSGYYLTDPEHGFALLDAIYASSDCGDGSIWDLLTKARSQAIRDFATDLRAVMSRYHEPRVKPWKGVIGQPKHTTKAGILATYAGVIIQPQPLRDASFVVTGIRLGLDASGDVTVNITSNDPDFVALTATVSVAANQFTVNTLDTPISLPMFSERRPEDLTYAIYYEMPEGAQHLVNKFTCCGLRQPWQQHLSVKGVTSDDTDVDEMLTGGADPLGLVLEGYFVCDELEWICNLEQFASSGVLDVVAKAIQAKGAAKLISAIIEAGPTAVNLYTLLGVEQLYARRQQLQVNYVEAVDWVARNFPQSATDCFVCKDKRFITRRGIMV